jgi:hypothetical protein
MATKRITVCGMVKAGALFHVDPGAHDVRTTKA